MRYILFLGFISLSFSLGESLTCYICATPGSEFSDSFDKCQNVFSDQESFFPFEDNQKCYNGAFCAKYILTAFNEEVIIRQCVSKKAIVDFDPENPPSPSEPMKINYKGYTADAYFCEKNYCNGASITSLSLIAFLLPLFLYNFILK